MTPNTREPHALESYATFWEPILVDAPGDPAGDGAPVQGPAPTPDTAAAKDAYLEFVEVTEDTPVPPRVDRI